MGALVGLACSGPPNLGAGEAGAGSGEEDGGLACSDFAAAKCAKFDACTQGVYTQLNFGTQAECQAREATACRGVLSAPDTTATPNGFEKCGKDITSGACADFFDVTNTTPACTPQAGPRANGRACVDSGQCQSAWCYAATGAVCGVCATRPAAGAPCAENVDCGGQGMLCSQAGTCAAVVALGGACDTGHPCGFALSCVGSTPSSSGTCQTAGAAVGDTCDPTRSTAPLCEHDFGLFCPSTGDRCVKSALVDAGQPCGVTPGMVLAGDAATPSMSALCAAGAACEPSSAPNGHCVAPVADGAECDMANGPPCLDPARCVSTSDASTSGTCSILDTTTTCN